MGYRLSSDWSDARNHPPSIRGRRDAYQVLIGIRVTAPHVVEALLETRKRHPTWGAKKLLAYMARKHTEWSLPAKSTETS